MLFKILAGFFLLFGEIRVNLWDIIMLDYVTKRENRWPFAGN